MVPYEDSGDEEQSDSGSVRTRGSEPPTPGTPPTISVDLSEITKTLAPSPIQFTLMVEREPSNDVHKPWVVSETATQAMKMYFPIKTWRERTPALSSPFFVRHGMEKLYIAMAVERDAGGERVVMDKLMQQLEHEMKKRRGDVGANRVINNEGAVTFSFEEIMVFVAEHFFKSDRGRIDWRGFLSPPTEVLFKLVSDLDAFKGWLGEHTNKITPSQIKERYKAYLRNTSRKDVKERRRLYAKWRRQNEK